MTTTENTTTITGPVPDWGTWVTQFASSPAATPPGVSLSASGTIISLFPESAVDLNISDESGVLAASAVLVGHFPIVLPDEFPLWGFFVTCDGHVTTSPNASAVLTLTVGHGSHCQEWPRQLPTTSTDEDIATSFFVSDMHQAFGAKGPDGEVTGVFPPHPPLTVSIGLHAQRASNADVVLANVSMLTIAMLTVVP